MAEASESSGLRRTMDAFAAVLKEKDPPLPAELAEVMGEASIEEETARRMLVYRSLVRRGIAGAIKAQIPGTSERLAYRAPRTGWYFVEVKLASPGTAVYALQLAKTSLSPR